MTARMAKRVGWRLAGLALSVVAIWGLVSSPALAQEAPDIQVVLDNLWIFIAGILVFLMQAGF